MTVTIKKNPLLNVKCVLLYSILGLNTNQRQFSIEKLRCDGPKKPHKVMRKKIVELDSTRSFESGRTKIRDKNRSGWSSVVNFCCTRWIRL